MTQASAYLGGACNLTPWRRRKAPRGLCNRRDLFVLAPPDTPCCEPIRCCRSGQERLGRGLGLLHGQPAPDLGEEGLLFG